MVVRRRVGWRRAAGEGAGDEARYALPFDPQTAGGLVAGVPAGNAEACVAELRELGYAAAAVIGRALEKSDALVPVRVV